MSLMQFLGKSKRFAIYCVSRFLFNVGVLMMKHHRVSAGMARGLLVVRLDAIGDFVLWLDSAKELRKLCPNEPIVLCANARWAELAKRLPYWDEVIECDTDRWIPLRGPSFRTNVFVDVVYVLRLLKAIRKRAFARAMQPMFSRTIEADTIVYVSGAPQRIASSGSTGSLAPNKHNPTNRWYTSLVQASPAPNMELIRNAEFLRGLSAEYFEAGQPWLDKLLDLPAKLTISQPYCVIFPGAADGGRRWPADQFAKAMITLQESAGWQMVLCGGGVEIELCREIANKAGSPVVNLAGQTSLLELVEVIRRAALVLSNETSAAHIAAATGVPCVCVLGGGHIGRFLPYATERRSERPVPIPVFHQMECFGCNWHCKHQIEDGKPYPCIEIITAEQVLWACQQAALCQVGSNIGSMDMSQTNSSKASC